MNKNENERLAVLENEVKHIKDEQKEQGKLLKDLVKSIEKFNGRWGLLIMAGSAILGVVTYFKSAVVNFFTGN